VFNNVGWGELLVIAALGLLIFGPDQLVKHAAQAGRLVRQLRRMAQGAAADLKAELGPEMADLDLRSLHPRTMMRDILFDESDEPGPTPAGRVPGPALQHGERPPYDSEAT
jgi:sec-independent protein translocase protein TatB